MLKFLSDELMMICAYLMPKEFLDVTMLNSWFNKLQKSEYITAFFEKQHGRVSIYRHKLDVAFCSKLIKRIQSELSFLRYGLFFGAGYEQLIVDLDLYPACKRELSCVISEREFHRAYWDMYTAILYDNLNLFLRGLRVAWYGFQHIIKCQYFCFHLGSNHSSKLMHSAFVKTDYPYMELITQRKKHLVQRNTYFTTFMHFGQPLVPKCRCPASLLDILIATIHAPRQDGLLRPAVKIAKHVYKSMPSLFFSVDPGIEWQWREMFKIE
jgi:hypothetical protein